MTLQGKENSATEANNLNFLPTVLYLKKQADILTEASALGNKLAAYVLTVAQKRVLMAV